MVHISTFCRQIQQCPHQTIRPNCGVNVHYYHKNCLNHNYKKQLIVGGFESVCLTLSLLQILIWALLSHQSAASFVRLCSSFLTGSVFFIRCIRKHVTIHSTASNVQGKITDKIRNRRPPRMDL